MLEKNRKKIIGNYRSSKILYHHLDVEYDHFADGAYIGMLSYIEQRWRVALNDLSSDSFEFSY